MQTEITLKALLQCGVIIMGCWGFYKVIMEIVRNITDRHDREKKWDEYEKNLQSERDKIYEKYDAKLIELEYERDINKNLKNIVNNDSIAISILKSGISRISADADKRVKVAKKQRNVAIGASVISVVLLIISIL